MKQVIVLMGVLPFLLLFMMQYSLEQQNHYRISILQQIVYEAKEQAKQDGYFTARNIQELKDKISVRLGVSKDDILIEATSIPKYRVNSFDERELIHYKVQVPIDEIMVGAAFLGIDPKDNMMQYVIENDTASELIKP